MRETEEVRDRVVLVGLSSPVLKKEENADEETMEELAALVETAGAETVGTVLQNRPSPDPRSFIGEGKVEEVRAYCQGSGATMVIFLSAGMLPQVQAALLEGAYTPDTPAALVYKATWPEEKVVRCTVGTLADCGRQNGISRTALVLVGDFLGNRYDRSRLYDPSFTTGYRKGAES